MNSARGPMDEAARYSRQVIMPQVGLIGQERLAEARVLIVGVGGLGCPAAMYLAAAGVGTIGLVDADSVDLTNLHRQLLFDDSVLGQPKVTVAAQRLKRLNPNAAIEEHLFALDQRNAESIVSQYDVVLDATDSFEARYAINDAAVALVKPNVHASVFSFEGQISVFDARIGPCYRCLFPRPPSAGVPSCAEAGVLGVLPGLMGVLQATEALKLILQAGEPLIGRLLIYDALGAQAREVRIPKDLSCPTCGVSSVSRQSESTVSEIKMNEALTPIELKAELAGPNPPKILDVREAHELEVSSLPGVIHIPLGQLPSRLSELDSEDDIVVMCRVGGRSAQAVAYLRQRGFKQVRNLTSGINGWAQTVDPTLPQY